MTPRAQAAALLLQARALLDEAAQILAEEARPPMLTDAEWERRLAEKGAVNSALAIGVREGYVR